MRTTTSQVIAYRDASNFGHYTPSPSFILLVRSSRLIRYSRLPPLHSRGAGGPTLFDQLLKVALPLLQNLVFAPPGQDQTHTGAAYQNVVNTTTAAGPATAAPPGQRRKAVLMGLNYAGSSCPLRGCHNDVRSHC